jgi:hypothetical protein
MSRGRKYIVPRTNVQISRRVLETMQARQFDPVPPVFTDDREVRWFQRIVKGAQAIADLEAGEKLHELQKGHLTRLNVLVEDGRVRRWGYLIGPWMVRAYGHAVNLRAGDVDDPRHPEYVRPAPEA